LLASVVRAVILLNLNRKSRVNRELGNNFRYIFNSMKTGKLVNEEKHFSDTCLTF
jgi:hypothetical protein